MNVPLTTPITVPDAALPTVNTADKSKLKSACEDFESVFFGMMLKEMRKTVPDDTLLGDDAHEQQIFQGMMDDNIAKEMASHSGSDSLATEMYRQLSHSQSAQAESSVGEVKQP